MGTLYALATLYGISIDELFEQTPIPERSPAARALHDAPDRAPERSDLAAPHEAWNHDTERQRIQVCRAGERSVLVMANGVAWEQLVPSPGRNVDFVEIMYPPGSSSTTDGSMLRHTGYELGCVLSGELEVVLGFEVVRLLPGDSICFESSVPHVLRNPGQDAMRAIWCSMR